MASGKGRSWLPPVGLLLAFIAACNCNFGACIDPAGEIPVLNLIMAVVYLAAWSMIKLIKTCAVC